MIALAPKFRRDMVLEMSPLTDVGTDCGAGGLATRAEGRAGASRERFAKYTLTEWEYGARVLCKYL